MAQVSQHSQQPLYTSLPT